MDQLDNEGHTSRLQLCIAEARKAPRLLTNYCVGALLYDPVADTVLITGHTMELEGNTHAEQCCFDKIASKGDEFQWPAQGVWLYTTMAPCIKRLSGAKSCVERIIDSCAAGRLITKVFVGVEEPDTFVKGNNGKTVLTEQGIEVFHVGGMEEEITKIATAGHTKR